MDYLKRVVRQIADFFGALTPAKKVGVAITSFMVVFGVWALFYWAGDKSYRPLMTNLNPQDSSNIIRILREKNIPFRVAGGGKTIEVTPESVDDLRLELATMGLPESSLVGYEIFDKQSLGTTSFVQKINQKRALEGELMRTISTIKGVKHSRVHLVLPKKSAFVEDQKKSTASVVLDLEPGVDLSEKQVYGIGILVSRAVEGLDIADVVIVDSNGKMLSKNPRDPLIAFTASQNDYQRKVEEGMEKRVEAMLAPVVGEGRVVARISTEMDFSQVSETQTTYDADGSAILSSQKDYNTADMTRPGPYGKAGAASNTPGEDPNAASQVKSDTKRNREITNFRIPQTTRRIQKPYGTVTKLSVAVLLDGKKTVTTTDKGEVQSKVDPWPPEKLQEFEKIVASSVGLNQKRGDTLEIKNIEFNREDFAESQRILEQNQRRAFIQQLTVYGILGLIILLFFAFVVRPFIKWVTENTIESVDTFLPQTIEELEKIQADSKLPGLEDAVPILPDKVDPEKVEGEMLKEKVITLIDAHPQKASLILSDWISGEAEKKQKAKEGAKTA